MRSHFVSDGNLTSLTFTDHSTHAWNDHLDSRYFYARSVPLWTKVYRIGNRTQTEHFKNVVFTRYSVTTDKVRIQTAQHRTIRSGTDAQHASGYIHDYS